MAGIYKASPSDSSFSVLFKFSDVVDDIVGRETLQVGLTSFEPMRMNEQVVSIRVHWLP